MALDKFSATWVSHSSMGDFLNCPRAYYLHNVYKDPRSRRKINVINPALALGQIVHEVVEGLADIRAEDRFKNSLFDVYERAWSKVTGKRGGFTSQEQEEEIKERGRKMIERVTNNPGPLKNKIIRISQDLPHYYLSEEDNIILCGKVDWLEYIPDNDTVHVLDFKTGKHDEKEDSLQLPIYHLLVKHCQKRNVSKASYWYLDKDDKPREVPLPDIDEAYERVLAVARDVKKTREEKLYNCPRGTDGCFACRPFEKIIQGDAEYIGVGEYNQDIYLVDGTKTEKTPV